MKYSLLFDTDGPTFAYQPIKPFINVRVDHTASIRDFSTINKEYKAQIDTGADYNLFDEGEFDFASMKPVPSFTVNASQTGAGTQRQTSLYRMSLLMPDHQTITTLPFVAIKMEAAAPHKIILGMDFIKNCDLVIHRGGRSGYLDFDLLKV